MEIKEINTSDIQTIFSWKYPTPYQQYDMPSLEVAKEQGYAILDPAKQHVFHTLYREDACVGYFRSYQIGDKTYLGIGLAPSYCGKGIGKEALHEILLYYAKDLRELYLEVDFHNIRAIKCYRECGFLLTHLYQKKTSAQTMRTYLQMRFTF